MMNKVLCIFHNSKIANTDHLSYMFSVVHNSIQKFTNISISKPIIFIFIISVSILIVHTVNFTYGLLLKANITHILHNTVYKT